MAKILLVDDEPRIEKLVRDMVEGAGYEFAYAENGADALALVGRVAPDLVIMDVMMPRLDGLSALMRIRERANIPVIVLSAKSEETDKVLGLSMGADDYVAKPYNPQELAARVKSHLRRFTTLGDIHAGARASEIRNGRLLYNTEERTLYADGEPVRLTATETKIVDLFMRNPGRVFPAEELYRRVWNEEGYACENTVMVHIRRIREKIEAAPSKPESLITVKGLGYKLIVQLEK